MLMTQGFASNGYKYILIEPCWQVRTLLFRAKEIKKEKFDKI
jgi:hypothetical protein